MPCPACDHTMQRVNEGTNPKVFWCPRCGTIKSEPGVPEFESPRIVGLVDKAADTFRDVHDAMVILGRTRMADAMAIAETAMRESLPKRDAAGKAVANG
jgi:hypothetical protein